MWSPGFTGFGGGIAAFGKALVQVLLLKARPITLCGRDDVGGSLLGQPLHGAGRWSLPLRKLAYAWLLLRLAGAQRPELVICTHLNYGPVALVARILFGIPYAVVGHGVEVDPGMSVLRRMALRRASAVWVVSRWTRDRARALGVHPDRIEILGNTVDPGRFHPGTTSDSLRSGLAVPAGARVVLTVARLDPAEGYKGCDAVLRALPRLNAAMGAVHYVIAGRGEDEVRLRELARQLKIEDRVHFAGFVDGSDLPGYYATADVYAMPSLGEGFGIVFLEAMASGTPVLGGNLDGTLDALDDGRLGALVDPRDDDAVASGLQSLLEGRGEDFWFEPLRLREACLDRHGPAAFQERIDQALARAGVH
ncbi:hypothetical protein GCM10023332_01690 [Luteimonas vadosa]|uniref:Glycosyltransferase family 4 protein n=1 Tax=Luteimonas vadosa TaxID=1165507 RepID=A0ABP9DN93_9GAMM